MMVADPGGEAGDYVVGSWSAIGAGAAFYGHLSLGVQPDEGIERVLEEISVVVGIDVGGAVEDEVMHSVPFAVTVIVIMPHEDGRHPRSVAGFGCIVIGFIEDR